MLQLNHVTKTFSGHFKPVLNDVTLTFNPAEFCVIIGSNGSGKSTLLRTIAGEYVANSGDIRINNQPHRTKRHLIASVIQDINQGTVPEMTLLENVVLGCLKKKATLRPYHSRRVDAIRRIQSLGINLERYLNTPLQCLSGGQRQMIATLMAVQSEPSILLLDEHTSALDPKTQHALMAYTAKAIDQRQMLALMVTHKLDDAIQYGNRLIMLCEGCVVLDVSGEQKQALSKAQLLDLFYHYENAGLMAEEPYEY